MVKSLLLGTTKYLFTDIILDIIKFPFWWYSRGFVNAGQRFLRHLKYGLQLTGLKVWVANIFKPMFGETSWQGRLISFFMRLVLLIFKTIAMAVWLVVAIAIFLLWLVVPIFVIYMIFEQLV